MFLLVLAPALFVVIWSTGWIVAKYAAPFADPLTFLAIRFALAAAVIALLAWATGAPWPPDRRTRVHAAISGVLLHAVYLGGVWWAISQGLPAGVSALIAAVQPLLTAALARTMGEKLLPINVAGIVVGFAGVLGVIAPKLGGVSAAGLSGLGLAVAINVGSMVAVTAGTYYQKHFVASGDLRTTTVLQYIGACLAILPFAILLEPMRFEMRLETWAAMAWSVVVLSIGAIGLMLLMIRRGAVSRVAALIYLIPPTAALQAYAMFGETLTPMQVVFMAVAAFGVFLATRR